MNKKVKSQLPAGFKPITGGGDSWHPEKPGEAITGIITAVKIVTMPAKGKQPERDVNLYTVKTKDGDINLWESAGLRALSKLKKGKPVYVEYIGTKQIKKGQAPMREFIVATKGKV